MSPAFQRKASEGAQTFPPPRKISKAKKAKKKRKATFKSDWRRTHNRYRLFLYTGGEEILPDPETGDRGRKGFSEEEVEAVVEKEGAMPIAEVLRHRVRYFSDGAVIGPARFIEEVFRQNRSRFSSRRETGARRMRGANWGKLHTLRDLRIDVIGP